MPTVQNSLRSRWLPPEGKSPIRARSGKGSSNVLYLNRIGVERTQCYSRSFTNTRLFVFDRHWNFVETKDIVLCSSRSHQRGGGLSVGRIDPYRYRQTEHVTLARRRPWCPRCHRVCARHECAPERAGRVATASGRSRELFLLRGGVRGRGGVVPRHGTEGQSCSARNRSHG